MRASFEKKRGKMLSKRQEVISSDLSQSKSSIREPEITFKVNPRATTIKNALEQAQILLQEERQAREDLEKKVSKLQLRGIQRQKQFRRIIQEAIPFCLKQRSNNVLSANLKTVHQKLLSFFEITQQQVEAKLLEEKQLLQEQMQRRIKALTEHAEQQLRQHKRLQTLSYEAIHREITTALTHSAEILAQNEEMKREIKQLTFNNSILKEERVLLIAEVLQKKNLILKMYSHLKEKYSRDDQIEKQITVLKKQRRKIELQYANYQSNQRKEFEDCFKTIQSIKPKAIHVFATDPSKDKTPIKQTHTSITKSTNKNESTPQRFFSTVDVKAKPIRSALHRTITTNFTDKDESAVVMQLRESLRREKKKSLNQAQKIEYLVGYKKEIDLFIRQCYRKGDLEELNPERIERLITNLKKVVEKEDMEEQKTKIPDKDKDYEPLLQDY